MLRLLAKQPNWLRRFAPSIIALAAGSIASITLWHALRASEQRLLSHDFIVRANNQAIILQKGIDEYLSKLEAVRVFFDSEVDNVSRGEFESFAGGLIKNHPAILNIAWAPRVTRGSRAAHELAAIRDGVPDYHIRDESPDDSRSAAKRPGEGFDEVWLTGLAVTGRGIGRAVL